MTNTNDTIIELQAGDAIRASGWTRPPYDAVSAEVDTARAFAKRSGTDPEAAHARAAQRGHSTCWTLYTGGSLARARAARQCSEEPGRSARAVTLRQGDRVRIEGEVFTVDIAQGNEYFPRDSDPIAFRPL